jgi:cell division septum initiation protein DivIVA
MIPEDSTKEELLLYIDDLQDLVFRLEQENRDLKDEIDDMMAEIRASYSWSDFEDRGL